MKAELALTVPADDKEAASSRGVLWNGLREGLASIRLALGLFIIIAIVATVGTVIPQGEPATRYVREYGETIAWWVRALGLADLFHTWWFAALLVLLCVNSLTCFSKRFPAIWRSLRQDTTTVSLPFLLGLPQHRQVVAAAEPQALAGEIAAALAKRGYRISAGHREAEVTLFARKGIMGRIGAHIGHLSVPVILLGGLLGVAFGFREFGAGVEGETYYIARGDFSVRVDRFWMDYYDTGAVKSYNSRLTIIDQGREVLARTIRVNDPLAYKGIWFYQSSYGDAWDRVAQVTLRISDRASGATLRDVVLQWQTETVLDDLGLRLTLTNFVSHFAFNPHTKTVYSKSVEHHNPAVKIMIAEGDRASVSLWLLFALPDLIQVQDSRYLFELIGYVPKKFTGLQIARDPGVGFVWVGSVMLVVGVTLSALIYHRRIWVKLLPDGQGTLVYVGGSTHKSRLDFSREFTRIVDGITRIGSHGQGESRKAGEGAACG